MRERASVCPRPFPRKMLILCGMDTITSAIIIYASVRRRRRRYGGKSYKRSGLRHYGRGGGSRLRVVVRTKMRRKLLAVMLRGRLPSAKAKFLHYALQTVLQRPCSYLVLDIDDVCSGLGGIVSVEDISSAPLSSSRSKQHCQDPRDASSTCSISFSSSFH